MVKFIENHKWVELPLEAVYNLFQEQPGNMIPVRTQPIVLEDGTVIDKAAADKGLLIIAVQKHLDDAAKAKGYDNIHSAAIRAGFVGPYQAEGVKFATWMDSVWLYCYQVLDEVVAGLRTTPSKAQLIAELPVLPA